MNPGRRLLQPSCLPLDHKSVLFQRVFHASMYYFVLYTRATCRKNSKHLDIHNKCYVHVAKLFRVVANVGFYVCIHCKRFFSKMCCGQWIFYFTNKYILYRCVSNFAMFFSHVIIWKKMLQCCILLGIQTTKK